jgi:exonuclease SbcC
VLNKLSYSVTFPTTGRTLAGEFEFKPGFGLINGANEQGKSLIIEVVRWCLFGSTALRGKAEDYKTLRATLQFSARGQSYVVDRTYTTAKLMQAMSCCASGQRRSTSTSLLCSGSGSTCYEQLRDIELWQRKQQFERRHPRPDYPASFRGGLPALRLPNVLPST